MVINFDDYLYNYDVIVRITDAKFIVAFMLDLVASSLTIILIKCSDRSVLADFYV